MKETLEQNVARYRADEERKHEARMKSIDDLADRGLVLDTLASNHGAAGIRRRDKRGNELADARKLQDGLENLATLDEVLTRQAKGPLSSKERVKTLARKGYRTDLSADAVMTEVASGRLDPSHLIDPLANAGSRGLSR